MVDHKKFFDKALDSEYVKKHFLSELQPLEIRQGKGLKAIADEYINKKNRLKNKNKTKGGAVQWDFSGSSGADLGGIAHGVQQKKPFEQQKPKIEEADPDDDFGLDENEG